MTFAAFADGLLTRMKGMLPLLRPGQIRCHTPYVHERCISSNGLPLVSGTKRQTKSAANRLIAP